MKPADYPNDADGEALRMVAEDGADMSRPMVVDFMVVATSESAANSIGNVARALGYETKVVRDTDLDENPEDTWTVYCTKTMLLTYESVIAAQDELDAACAPYDGYSDGWGTFGNTQSP
jgi:regulator of RNase E activity RraB